MLKAEDVSYAHLPEAPEGTPPEAARAGDLVFYAGGMAAHPATGIAPEIYPHPELPNHWSHIRAQLMHIYGRMGLALESLGSSMRDSLKINTYQTRLEETFDALNLREDYFGGEAPPPSTLVYVPALAVPGLTVTTDLIAVASDAELGRVAVTTSTDDAPIPPLEQVFGHRIYIKATRGGGFIFTAGLTNNTRHLIPGAEVPEHPDFPYREDLAALSTEITLRDLEASLEEMGASLADVVRAEVHLHDMGNLAGVDEAWQKFFPDDPPARIVVPAGFPAPHTVVEIELIAVDPEGPYRKETIAASSAPTPASPEPHAVRAGPYLFLSGLMATDYVHGLAPEARADANFPFHTSPIKREADYVLKNAEAICRAGGASLTNLVRRRAMHVALDDLGAAEASWRDALGDRLPPTTVFQTSTGLPVPDCRVQYDLIAYAP